MNLRSDPRTPSGPLPAPLLRAHLYSNAARRESLAVEADQLGRERPDLRPAMDLLSRFLRLQIGTDHMLASSIREPMGFWERAKLSIRVLLGS